MTVDISIETHRELYHDWCRALEFCRALPDVSPSRPTLFHMYWRERTPRLGFFERWRPFGRKQALPLKAFLATQDPALCRLWLWSDADLSDNPWVRPFLERIELKVYDPAAEARGTELEARPEVYRQRDARVYRDGDLFRILVLHNHGGVYFDADTVLLRSLGVFLDQEFLYQWDKFEDMYAPALLRLDRGSAFARELIRGTIAIRAGKYNWGRENVRRAFGLGHRVTVFPSPFFNTEWQADPGHEPFKRTPNSAEMYEGAFAWHWHNRWDEPIEPGCKFALLEAAIERRLREQGVAVPDVEARR